MYSNVLHYFFNIYQMMNPANVLSDHVALPSKGGAMENWGLITYSEEILCINNETSNAHGKFKGVTIVSHEIAHMVPAFHSISPSPHSISPSSIPSLHPISISHIFSIFYSIMNHSSNLSFFHSISSILHPYFNLYCLTPL